MQRGTSEGNTGTSSGYTDSSQGNSGRIDPQIANAARHSDAPNVSTYDRPATTRITSANLWLSMIVLVVVLVMAAFVFGFML